MKTIKVGGVPEHFNLPWHLCIENESFLSEEIDLIWKDFPGGTGAMCKALRNGEIDVAVILTEGITRDIINGNESSILQEYIGSPLIWGIHVAAGSPYKNIKDLEETKAAISRYGSGSHLMAYVNAQHQRWNIDELKFEVINDINGAVEALANDDAQYFMWEHFTTKPLVDNKTFRLIADCPTPWPCFVIAARNDRIDEDAATLKKMVNILNAETKNFKQKSNIEMLLSQRYDQKPEDIKKWLEITSWSQKQVSENALEKVQNTLASLGLIDKKEQYKNLVRNI